MLLLTHADVIRLLDLSDCITAVERAFADLGAGRTRPPGALGHASVDGGFHVKAASLRLDRHYFAAKVNGNFFRNTERGLPRIQGVIVLSDADDGTPLAVMDSIEITAQRTAATTAVAAKYLARRDSQVLAIAGCGVQGRFHVRALRRVLPIRRVLAFDTTESAARRFAADVAYDGLEVVAVDSFPPAARQADVVVTCTPSRAPILGAGDVKPGAFVAAVGADAEDKQEIDPELLAKSAVIVDSLTQCATFGDLHHAIAAGVMRLEDVRAELADVVAGRKAGRLSDQEVVLFDSTGTAIQDVAAAAVVYTRARRDGGGLSIDIRS